MGSSKDIRRRNVKSSRIAPDLTGTKSEKRRKSEPYVSKATFLVVVAVVIFLTGAYYRYQYRLYPDSFPSGNRENLVFQLLHLELIFYLISVK